MTNPMWSGLVTTRETRLTVHLLEEMRDAILMQPAGRVGYFIVPAARGKDSAARRRRTVRLSNGMRLELPEGMSAQEFLLMPESVAMAEVLRRSR